MTKDIVEAYALAVKARETCTRKAFSEVVNFCENDLVCSGDNSTKRNTLMLWSYDKLAQTYAKANNYAQAYDLWLKAVPLSSSFNVKLNLGLNLLFAANKGFDTIREKAAKIIEAASILQKIYHDNNDFSGSQKMQRLIDSASRLLEHSKMPT